VLSQDTLSSTKIIVLPAVTRGESGSAMRDPVGR